MLRKDAAKTAAQKDDRIVSATCIAGLVDRTYTAIFDLNASEGIKVQGQILDLIVVKHDQKTQMSHGITLSCSGYTFIGEWNDDKDGEGAFYRAGNRIENFSHITLDAQWEDAAAFADEKRKTHKPLFLVR